MSYAQCLKCNAILISRYRHDFVTCKCDNQTFIDGGDDYFRCGGLDLSLIKKLDIPEPEDVVVNTLYSTAIVPVIEKLIEKSGESAKSRYERIDSAKIIAYAENIISTLSDTRNEYLSIALKFVVKSFVWFTEQRQLRKPIKVESGYLDFMVDLCDKYSTNIDTIERFDLVLSNADRIKLNDMYRACEQIEYRRFNEDSSFCADVIRYRREIFGCLTVIV